MALPVFKLKEYQVKTLAVLGRFLEATVRFGKSSTAFTEITNRPYYELPQLPGLPYVCLRVPTGGGKTVMAAYSVGIAADTFLRTDAPTVLWLVPSKTIHEQTLMALQDRTHPNRRALAERFGENIRIMTVSDALYAKRADYDGGVVVIVGTIQAFRVEETEGRKVYEANGELMDHFAGLPDGLRSGLDKNLASGEPIPSLANVLHIRRPMVIVDEAHNARTPLSFDMLGRLSPSLIVEFTATPVTPEDSDVAAGRFASNVLHHVSAAELKAADMIKLPIILRGRPDPRDTIGDAIAWLDELNITAQAEQSATGEFVRPVMLLQAEPKSRDKPTLHADEVSKLLKEDFRVPEEHIVIATGDAKGLDGVDLFDPECKIRFIITQQALKEGWDCSFAYVLCSVAEQRSPRAVEQLLGRVLRLPGAKRKQSEDLNRAYAFATTQAFQDAANTLRDGLVSNGFERVEAQSLVKAIDDHLPGFEDGGRAFVFEEVLPATIDAEAAKVNLEKATGGRIEIDAKTGAIRAKGALTEYDRKTMLLALGEAAAKTVNALVHRSRGARLTPVAAEKEAIRFAVPRLAVRTSDGVLPFDRTHFLDDPWKLEECDPAPVLDYFAPPKQTQEEAHLDVSKTGQVTVEFVKDLHEQLRLALAEKGWTRPALINWLDRRLPRSARQDITRTSTTLFISKALGLISEKRGMDDAALARAKYRLLEAALRAIADHRDVRQRSAFQMALLPRGGLEFETSSKVELVFDESQYAYSQPYRGGTKFNKHLFPVIGDLDVSGEEYQCAVYLERHESVSVWVRNTSQQPYSFWLQTSTDKFYPDFLALLEDGRVLVVEYKGTHLVSTDDSKEKALIGALWAERSQGSCVFVMVDGKKFDQIDKAIGAHRATA